MNKEKIKEIQERVVKIVLEKYDLDVSEPIGEEINIIGATRMAVRLATEETIKAILEELQKANPYPEDIFTPMTAKEIKSYVKLLTDNGFSSDKIHGNWGRKVWNNCHDKIKKQFGVK